MIGIPGRIRAFLRVVVFVLTHVRKTNGFPSYSKTAAFIARDINGLPLWGSLVPARNAEPFCSAKR